MWCKGWGDVGRSCRRGCPDRGAAVAQGIVLLFFPKCTTRKGGIYILKKKKMLESTSFLVKDAGKAWSNQMLCPPEQRFQPQPQHLPSLQGQFP